MGKNKLSKFADMEGYPHVFQYTYSALTDKPFEMRGQWGSRFFGNDNPIVLELGCGRAEYTLGLARMNRHCNYIGVDIKGARMWTGATAALNEGLANVAFLRTHIEMIDRFFAAGEVSEVWLTFPDPQMKKASKRLTSTGFLNRYRRFLTDGGLIHLKTDSNFLFTYTRLLVGKNTLPLRDVTDNLYSREAVGEELAIRTYYEQQWLDRGKTIKYISFGLPQRGELSEPEVEIELDDYRSYNRSKRSGLQTSK